MKTFLRFGIVVCVGLAFLSGCQRPQRAEKSAADPDFQGFYCPGCKQGMTLER